MRTVFLSALIFSIAIFVIHPGALAENSKVTKGEKAAEKQDNPPVVAQPDIDKYQDKTEDVYEILKKISADLTPVEQKHFYMIYNNYNLVGTVKMVQGDVGKAIDACSDANPEMENELRSRYQTWLEAVVPVVKDAEAHIDNMVAAQEYAKPKDIKSLFKAIDKTRKFTNSQTEKTAVTTPEACEYLRNKMGSTQKNLVRLMKQTLISLPAAADKKLEKSKEQPEEKQSVKDQTEASDSKDKADE